MGTVIHKNKKPLQVSPFKLSQPMGAVLAFLGVDKCMPLMHGGQGCTSFTKVFFTRHFCEPIAIQTSAVTDAIGAAVVERLVDAVRAIGLSCVDGDVDVVGEDEAERGQVILGRVIVLSACQVETHDSAVFERHR